MLFPIQYQYLIVYWVPPVPSTTTEWVQPQDWPAWYLFITSPLYARFDPEERRCVPRACWREPPSGYNPPSSAWPGLSRWRAPPPPWPAASGGRCISAPLAATTATKTNYSKTCIRISPLSLESSASALASCIWRSLYLCSACSYNGNKYELH